MQVQYLLERNECRLRESAGSGFYVRLITTNGSNTPGQEIFVHPATVQQNYVHEDQAILHDNPQREPHKFYGPPTSHVIEANT